MTLNIDKYLKQGDSKLQRTSLDVSKYLNKGTPSSESQSKVYQVPDYMGGGSYRGVSGLSSKELEPYRSSRETSTTAKNEMRGGTFSDTEKEIDHIISIFLGGTDAEENQQPLQNSKSLIQAVRDVVTMNDRKASQYATRQGGKYDIEKKAIEKYRNGEIGLGAARLAILNYKKPDVAKRFLGEEDSFFDKFKDFWGGAKRKIEEYQQDDAYSGPAEEQISSKTDDRGWAAKTLIATSKFTLSIAQTVTSTLDFLIDTSIKRVGDRVIEIQEGGDGVFGNRYRTEEETSNMKDKVKQRRDDWEKFFIKNEKQMPVQKAKDFLTKIRDKRIYQPTKKWENASAVERFTPEHIGETIFELGPDIASSIATFVVAGPTVGAALFGGAAADDMKTTAMKYGVDFDDATGLGLLSGVAATVLERVLPAKLMNKKVVSKISQGLLRRVSGYLLSAGIEASTEVSQETVSLLLENTFREDLNWSEANIRLAMAGFGGALGGAGMNVLIDVVNSSKLSSVDIDDDFSVDYKQPEKTQTPPAEEGLTIEAPIDTKPKPELNIDKYLKKPVKEKTTETEAKTISMQELEIKKKEYDNFEDFKKAYKDYDIVEDSDVSYKIDDKDIEVLRGTKGMTADDIMKTHPNIKLKRDVPAKDVAGNKVLIPEGEKLTPYEMKDGKILLQDGQTYLVTKNQFANIKGQSVGGEAKPFAPELEGTEETTMGWTGDSRDLADTTRPQTKYSQYTLPDGENYKEILIKAPTRDNSPYVLKKNDSDKVLGEYPNIKEAQEALTEKGVGHGIEPMIPTGQPFKSSHWSEPNVLSHLRMNDRTYKGKAVSFMEELQSDWAKEGRDKGFVEDVTKYQVLDSEGEVLNTFDTMKEAQAIADSNNERFNSKGFKAEEYTDKINADGVPNSPLLKNWQEMTVKRALLEAVNSNAEYFAWINGAQTSARYNLATYLDNASWSEKNDIKKIELEPKSGSNIVLAIDKDGKILSSSDSSWNGKKLDEALGKGLADSIMVKPTGTLSGEGLKFGGEWAVNLYDKQVPNIVKKLTGAEIIEMDMKLPIDANKTSWYTTEPSGDYRGGNVTKGELTIEDLKEGEIVKNSKADYYVITDVLGDGKFMAVPSRRVYQVEELSEPLVKQIESQGDLSKLPDGRGYNNLLVETLDISEKKTTQQGIKLTPEVIAKIKGEAPAIETSGKMFKDKDVSNKYDDFTSTGRLVARKRAEAFLRRMFPNNDIDLYLKKELFDDEGRAVLGKSFGKIIEVIDNDGNVKDKVLYHESFHTFLRYFITDSERIKLLEHVKKEYAEELSKYKDYKTLNKKAEELLADKFADYVKTKETKTPFARFFRAIFRFFSNIKKNKEEFAKLFDYALEGQTKQLSDGKKQNDYGYKIDDNTLKGIWEGKQKPKPTPTPTKTITLETVNKKDLGDRSVEEVEARRKEREGELGQGDKFSLHYEKIKDMYPALDSDGMEIGVQKQKEQLDWARDYIQRNPDKAIKIAYGTADIPAGKNTQILRGATIASLYADGRVELADMIAKKASLSLTESARELSAAKMDLYPKDKPKIELGITQKRLELLGAKLGETDPTKMVQKAKEKVKSDTKNVTDKIKKTQSEMTINNLEEIDNIIDSLLC